MLKVGKWHLARDPEGKNTAQTQKGSEQRVQEEDCRKGRREIKLLGGAHESALAGEQYLNSLDF